MAVLIDKTIDYVSAVIAHYMGLTDQRLDYTNQAIALIYFCCRLN